jgi:glycosyltransferase involved in cell wall biosynthesis
MTKKRWLEWTLVDPRTIVGGVETHLLSMAACLEKSGYEVSYSSDPEVLFRGADERGLFDVVRTHGAALPKGYLFGVLRNPRTYRIHTLHGSAIGMMLGLRQWWRVTHYKAFYRELSGCLRSDLVASIHPGLILYQAFQRLRRAVVIWNGWDSERYLSAAPGILHSVAQEQRVGSEATASPDRLRAHGNGAWAFIGRLWDRMKASDRVWKVLEVHPALIVAAVPGEGVPDHPRVRKTGRLSPQQVSELLKSSQGLLLPSRYEGLSLVLLEALAAGVPVLATQVGGHGYLKGKEIQGLVWIENPDAPQTLAHQLEDATRRFHSQDQ